MILLGNRLPWTRRSRQSCGPQRSKVATEDSIGFSIPLGRGRDECIPSIWWHLAGYMQHRWVRYPLKNPHTTLNRIQKSTLETEGLSWQALSPTNSNHPSCESTSQQDGQPVHEPRWHYNRVVSLFRDWVKWEEERQPYFTEGVGWSRKILNPRYAGSKFFNNRWLCSIQKHRITYIWLRWMRI